jgi:hypothetical protein
VVRFHPSAHFGDWKSNDGYSGYGRNPDPRKYARLSPPVIKNNLRTFGEASAHARLKPARNPRDTGSVHHLMASYLG